MRALVIAFFVLLSAPAAAEVVVHYPVTIPQECFELAQREGVPTVIEISIKRPKRASGSPQ